MKVFLVQVSLKVALLLVVSTAVTAFELTIADGPFPCLRLFFLGVIECGRYRIGGRRWNVLVVGHHDKGGRGRDGR